MFGHILVLKLHKETKEFIKEMQSASMAWICALCNTINCSLKTKTSYCIRLNPMKWYWIMLGIHHLKTKYVSHRQVLQDTQLQSTWVHWVQDITYLFRSIFLRLWLERSKKNRSVKRSIWKKKLNPTETSVWWIIYGIKVVPMLKEFKINMSDIETSFFKMIGWLVEWAGWWKLFPINTVLILILIDW